MPSLLQIFYRHLEAVDLQKHHYEMGKGVDKPPTLTKHPSM